MDFLTNRQLKPTKAKLSDRMNLEELNWGDVRLISIEGTSVNIILKGGVQRSFQFQNEKELSLALRLWGEHEERVKELLQQNGFDRGSSPKEMKNPRQTGL